LARVASSCSSNEFWALRSFFQAKLDKDILTQQQQLKQTHSLQHWEIIDLMYHLLRQEQHSQGNNRRVPEFSIQSGRVVLETPEVNPMVATLAERVLERNNRNTMAKGEDLPIYVFKGQKP
jgi:hypothetical protein